MLNEAIESHGGLDEIGGGDDTVSRAEFDQLAAKLAEHETDAAAKATAEANALAGWQQTLADMPNTDQLATVPATLPGVLLAIMRLNLSAAMAGCPKAAEVTELTGKVTAMGVTLEGCAQAGNANGFATTASLQAYAKADELTVLEGKVTGMGTTLEDMASAAALKEDKEKIVQGRQGEDCLAAGAGEVFRAGGDVGGVCDHGLPAVLRQGLGGDGAGCYSEGNGRDFGDLRAGG